jgi:hypothetical protein
VELLENYLSEPFSPGAQQGAGEDAEGKSRSMKGFDRGSLIPSSLKVVSPDKIGPPGSNLVSLRPSERADICPWVRLIRVLAGLIIRPYSIIQ